MAIVTLATGSNLGNRYDALSKAIEAIENLIGDILVCSSFYESEPWGFDSNNPFLNQTIILSSQLSPYEILETIQKIEKGIGRREKTNNHQYTDRKVDIDIIFYDQQIIFDAPTLIIPHPHMHKRRFVLEPLNEIASTLIHPSKNISISALLSACVDTNKVKPAEKLR